MITARRPVAAAVGAVIVSVASGCATTTAGTPLGSGSTSASAPRSTRPSLSASAATSSRPATSPPAGSVSYGSTAPSNGGVALPSLDRIWGSRIGPTNPDDELKTASSDGTNVYVNDGSGTVWSLAGASGTVRWRKHPGSNHSGIGVTVLGDTVFYDDTNSDLYALDTATGATRWHRPANVIRPAETVPLAVAEGVVIIPADDLRGDLGVDVATGKRVWQNTKLPPEGYFTSDRQRAYIAFGDSSTNYAVAVNPSTGKSQWVTTLDRNTDADTYAYATGGLLLVVEVDPGSEALADTIHALDPATGRTKWTAKTAGFDGQSLPVTVGRTIAFPSQNGVEGLDATSGRTGYTTKVNDDEADAVTECGSYVCGFGVDFFVVLDADGRVLKTVSLPDFVSGVATATSGPVFISATNTVYAYG